MECASALALWEAARGTVLMRNPPDTSESGARRRALQNAVALRRNLAQRAEILQDSTAAKSESWVENRSDNFNTSAA